LQITGGNLTDQPLAAYVEGSAAPRSGDTIAALYGYLPKASQSPGQWSGELLGESSYNSTLPVEIGASNDGTVGGLASDFPNTDTSSDGYSGLYVLRLATSGPDESATSTYDSAVIKVTGSTWSILSPAPSLASTTTTLSETQTSPQPYGTSVQLNASVSPAIPGTVQFEDHGVAIGSPVTVAGDGTASTSANSLPAGTDTLSAVFTPETFLAYAGSTGTSSFTVSPLALTLTPVPTISGSAVTGATLTAHPGTWDSGVSLSYQWFNNGTAISGAASSAYTLKGTDYNEPITVAVTGSKTNYASATETSAPVTPGLGSLVLTPVPTISGSAVTGGTLTAHPGTWDSGVSLSYQWSNNGTAISGAASSTYTLKGTDYNEPITVAVTGSELGYASVTKTSSGVTPGLGTLTLTPAPTISGTTSIGDTLTANPGTWDSGVSLSYQWFNDGTAISEATSTTYVLTNADFNEPITVAVTGSELGYASVTKTSSGVTPGLGTLTLTPTPTISGSAVTGGTLTAHPGTWDSGVSLSYQWLRNGDAISEATSTTYVLTAADDNQDITVSVTGSDSSYNPVTKTSSGVTPGLGSLVLTPVPTISGSAVTGGTLTAHPGTWDSGVSLSYQWSNNGTAISGAASSTYTLKGTDYNEPITVAVTGSELGYASVTKTSSGVTPGLGTLTLTPVPTVSGTPVPGSTLTANAGSWDSGVTVGLQWYSGTTAISGATSATYEPTSSDVGAAITVEATGTKLGYTTVIETSAATTILRVLSPTPTPTITGTAKTGLTLTAHPGTWGSGATLRFQWQRNGVAISGATSSTYTLAGADFGQSITVAVTGSETGFETVTKTSAAETPRVGSLKSTPTPTITGSAKTGLTLTAHPGTWDSGVSLSYQWLRNGVAISGAASSTYTLKGTDFGKKIKVVVTGSALGYTSVAESSAAVIPTAGTLSPTLTPTITGTAKTGLTLTAHPGTWGSGATLSYQWLRNGVAISGAASSTYTLVGADFGQKITVVVTGRELGYTLVAKTSAAVTPKAGTLTLTPIPTVTQKVGTTILTATPGTWDSGATLTYQWSASGVKIAGATKATLDVPAADVSEAVVVAVTGSKLGYASTTERSVALTPGG
jgi:hypothetical protein